MAEPTVNIKKITAYKISKVPGKDNSIITFSFDKEIQAFTMNLLGTSNETGTPLDFIYKDIKETKQMKVSDLKIQTVRNSRLIESNIDIITEIKGDMLYKEGDNRINIYGKDLDGEWTKYMT